MQSTTQFYSQTLQISLNPQNLVFFSNQWNVPKTNDSSFYNDGPYEDIYEDNFLMNN